MTLSLASRARRLIPRWRSPRVSAHSGEWEALRPTAPTPAPEGFFRAALAEFEEHPGLPTALEVVAGGLMLNRSQDAAAAAQFLLDQDRATGGARGLAESLLAAPNHLNSGPEPFSEDKQRATLARFRASLRIYPWNPILWVEMARAYLFLGQSRPAQRAMRVAVALAPHHRFVLRAATRLLVHVHEEGEALFLLDRTPRTLQDPWLLAARLATAQVAKQPALHTKAGKQLLSSASFAPLQTSELAGALGSLEFARGNVKYAQRFFTKSLEDPTENALAQAVWVHPDLEEVTLPIQPFLRRRAFEATAQMAYWDRRWKDALAACSDWAMDEPFSSRPIILASFMASVILDDPQQCERFCRLGLSSNPHHPGLTNNLAVALAYQGRLQEAQGVLASLPAHGRDSEQRPALVATTGLLAFRAGDPDRGRARYEQALDLAKANPQIQALALLHLALEELPFDVERAASALGAAELASHGSKDPAVDVFCTRVRARLAQAKELQNATLPSGQVGRDPATLPPHPA